MRPRFTIRLTIIAITLIGVACYVLFVRPSNVAYRCIRAINERDHAAAHLLKRDHLSGDIFGSLKDPSTTFVYAEALPREWRDVWSFQHRFIFREGRKDTSNGRHVEWMRDTLMVAFVDGVEPGR